MSTEIDRGLASVVALAVLVLAAATVVGIVLGRRPGTTERQRTVGNLNARIRSWWVMVAVLAAALVLGPPGTVALFMLVSLLALREFVSLVPIRRGDHRSLLWVFFIVTPLQYWFVFAGAYGMFLVFIPVWVFLLVAARSAVAAETDDFLARTSTIQWALMVCVYCLSHVPALLTLLPEVAPGSNAGLLLFLLLVVEGSDVFQYVWGKLIGRHPVAPKVSPNKTWEGLVGGVASAVLLGALLWRMTPFSPVQAASFALAIAIMGFLGGLTMSAIKRDRGVKDFGTLIPGHGGVVDRIDSLCFAAPVFFHLVRYFFG